MGKRGHRVAGAVTGVVTACFTFVGGAAPTTPASVDYLPLARREARALLRQVTHRVMSFGCAASNNGTAVQLDDGNLLTAAHVVAGTRLINVVPDLGPTTIATAEVSGTHDLALLHQPPATVAAAGAGVAVAPDDPPAGTRVLIAGYPRGQLSLVVGSARIDGWIDGRLVGQEGPVLRVRIPATNGMSGGPLLDPAGRLAGILVATRSGTSESFAIPASTIRAALAEGVTRAPSGGC